MNFITAFCFSYSGYRIGKVDKLIINSATAWLFYAVAFNSLSEATIYLFNITFEVPGINAYYYVGNAVRFLAVLFFSYLASPIPKPKKLITVESDNEGQS